jgi:hypothetical protein
MCSNYIFKCQLLSKVDRTYLIGKTILINNKEMISDSLGCVEVNIYYETSESFNLFKIIHENSILNKKFVNVQIDNICLRFKNRWRKFGRKYCKNLKSKKKYEVKILI